ncbi:uncharacterized protein G2W53_038812 [Senna tora]|uniref:Uncharacterized protein n=1 Tax=Senna tora TaxID=362788 RepID=A0A834SNZ8_9FABA|nr:uncharacterized protein G2W53_038812 [Senna tora]
MMVAQNLGNIHSLQEDLNISPHLALQHSSLHLKLHRHIPTLHFFLLMAVAVDIPAVVATANILVVENIYIGTGGRGGSEYTGIGGGGGEYTGTGGGGYVGVDGGDRNYGGSGGKIIGIEGKTMGIGGNGDKIIGGKCGNDGSDGCISGGEGQSKPVQFSLKF